MKADVNSTEGGKGRRVRERKIDRVWDAEGIAVNSWGSGRRGEKRSEEGVEVGGRKLEGVEEREECSGEVVREGGM